MAEVIANEAFWSGKDAANRDVGFSIRISDTAAKAYAAAADAAARAASGVGALISTTSAASGVTPRNYGVRYAFIENTATAPAEDSGFLRGNKLTIQYSGSGRSFVTTIPAYDITQLTVVNGNQVVLADAGTMAAIKNALDATGRDINGNAIVVEAAYLND